ncbi:hypothetical protein RUND412_010660 [Rhizina undulata]
MVKVCTVHKPCPSVPAPAVFDFPGKYPAKQHCQNVAARLPVKDGIIFLQGQQTILFEDSDYGYKFRQRRYFLYLTGVWDMADCAMTYMIEKDILTLYIPPADPSRILWSGPQPSPQDCLKKYDVDIVLPTTALSASINVLHNRNPSTSFYTIPPSTDVFPTSATINSTLLKPAINDCRVYKDAYEIALLRHANHITALAHNTILQTLRTNTARNEADLEALFIATSISNFAKSQAYSPIVASGTNAATLHYENNTSIIRPGTLLLLDAAAEWQGYAADVTRTFPISGRFSPQAKQIYDLVDEMQRECIKASVPGVDWAQTHFLAHKVAIKGLLKLGILTGGTEEEIFKVGTSKAFFPHGLGHFIGLEVHDVEGTPDVNWSMEELDGAALLPVRSEGVERRGGAVHTAIRRVLEPGMVITVEPGIYFSRHVIETYRVDPNHAKFINWNVLEQYWDVGGVRIEDNIVITETGNELITTAPRGY